MFFLKIIKLKYIYKRTSFENRLNITIFIPCIYLRVFVKIEKVLIIRFSSLGDVLLTTPIIRALKRKYKEAHIDFLIKGNYSEAIKNNPLLNRIYEYDKEKNTSIILDEILRTGYDYVVDLQNNFRSRSISSKIKTKTFRFNKPTIKKFLLVKFKWNLFKKIKSIPEMYSESVPDLVLDDNPAQLFIPEEVVPSVKPDKSFIGFAPGSKHFTKMYPPEYFIELGKVLSAEGYTILLFGGQDDREICKQIHDSIPDSINLSTENDLYQVARDMQECKLIVCNDSGLMHTATSVNVPVVTIFGSTLKEFGFFPYKSKSIVIENDNLSCRPCSHIGRSSCPKGHFKCMLELKPELVAEKIQSFIGQL